MRVHGLSGIPLMERYVKHKNLWRRAVGKYLELGLDAKKMLLKAGKEEGRPLAVVDEADRCQDKERVW